MRKLKIGRPDWDKPQPPDGFPPLKKADHAESEWNEALWPPSGWPEDVRPSSVLSCYSGAFTKGDISQKLIAKGRAETEYLVCFSNFIFSISIDFLTLLTG